MALFDLENLKSLLNSGANAGDEAENFKKLLLMVLSKATRVDLHTDSSEVELVQKIIKDYTGDELDAGTIRAEAITQSQEESMRPVARLAAKLPENMRVLAIIALRDVIQADERVSYTEIDYFNAVASAMRLSYADVAGLVKD